MNELIARLMLHDLEKFDYSLHALSTMRNALESPLSESLPPEKHNWLLGYLPAAAKLVETMGPLMRSWDFEFPPNMGDPKYGQPGKGGPLWNGKNGFCKGRWDYWRERFFAISEESGLDQQKRTTTQNASEAMMCVDRDSM